MAKAIKFKKREIDKNKTKEQREYEATREMTDFYRQNPHRFISTELGCQTLTWFQDLIIYLAFRSNQLFYIATRGIGKSYIIAWIVVAMAILYPRIKIVIASSTRSQARLLVTQKIIGEIYNRFPNVRKEIDLQNSSQSFNDTYVKFYNGSEIVVVTSTESSRGNRCAVLICEESAKMDINIKDNVLSKFLQNGERVPRYKSNPQFASYKPTHETKKEIHITSGDFQTNKLYLQCMDAIKHMVEHKDFRKVFLSMHWGFPCAEPYINMSYEEDIEPQLNAPTFSKLFWEQENEGLFSNESQFSMFSYQGMKNIRTVKEILVPIPDYLFTAQNSKKDIQNWKQNHYIEKNIDEIRILSIDVAMVGGNGDNTIYTLLSAKPNNKGNEYDIKILYMEHASGAHSEEQSIKTKRLYYDFDVDVILLDCQGNGIGVADALSKKQNDAQRDMTYPAFTVFNRENMKDRMYNVDSNDDVVCCIYSIKQDPKFNHNMITYLKSAVERGSLQIPIEYGKAIDYYEERAQIDDSKDKKDRTAKIDPSMINTYANVNLEIDFFVKEVISLEVKQQSNSPYLKVENNTMRKDRFSSVGFGVYWIKLQESELNSDEERNDLSVEEMYFEL